ncbi:CopZ family metallochaperone [Candidatus Thiodictyon syntrophicum]|jgi:copper chaperone|uniref:Heavy metal-binding protein n=1 Tax=Candidatus Thiodictyon syntrophicum TaxID=1166950 RepID=A0A2K8UA55_9GAMM|nr:heavy metal-associated domain-containing protein [Candidatus Thiodictyon syntrophicum]AUB82445.1 heavy metal-binding protein [Candidatus Thiodictyon syntrophicum]
MTTTIKVTGMTCQHCVRAVREALAAVPGVTAALVDLDGGTARVEGEAAAADLIHAVVDAGYQADLVAAG